LTDIGIDPTRLGPAWIDSQKILADAVKRRDLSAFQRGVLGLGSALGDLHPRSVDDVNELPDEVQ